MFFINIFKLANKAVKISLIHILLSFVYIYKIFIDPFKQKSCKYNIPCSTFAIRVIKKYGAIKGLYFAIRRILTCF